MTTTDKIFDKTLSRRYKAESSLSGTANWTTKNARFFTAL